MSTTNPQDCLSVIELVAIEHDEGSEENRRHLELCPRCQGLRDLLKNADLSPEEDSPQVRDQLSRGMARVRPQSDGEGRTGEIWRAVSDGHWSEIVVVVGSLEDDGEGDELFMVAPTSTELASATQEDLIVPDSPLGYAHLVCLGVAGPVERHRLDEYVGRLGRSDREAIVAVDQWLSGAAEEPTDARLGLPVVGEDDPRLGWHAALADRMRAVYTSGDRALLEAQPATVGMLVTTLVTSDEWDEPTLAEAASITVAELRLFRADDLDLTQQRDIPALARVLKVVELGGDEAELRVRGSLSRSTGGHVIAGETSERLAASSFAVVSDEDRDQSLHEDLLEIDRSEEGRNQAVEAYIAELRAELDS